MSSPTYAEVKALYDTTKTALDAERAKIDPLMTRLTELIAAVEDMTKRVVALEGAKKNKPVIPPKKRRSE